MPARRHSDELYEFSYRLFSLEFKITKMVFFALALYGLYELTSQHFGFKIVSAHEAATSAAAPPASSRSGRTKKPQPTTPPCAASPAPARQVEGTGNPATARP